MSLYDHENPQHLDYLARAKASSRRVTDRFEDDEIRDRVRQILDRDQGSPDTDTTEAVWETCEYCERLLVDGYCASCDEPAAGMVEAKAAGRIDDANRREPWAKRVAGGQR